MINKHSFMKTSKLTFLLSILFWIGINIHAENPNKTNLSIVEQSCSDYYIHGLDYVYNQVGKRFTIIGDKPTNVRVEWKVGDLEQVTQSLQYVVVVRGKAKGLQTVSAHVYGDNLDIILTKQVMAIDADDPNPNDTGYIQPWWW